LWLSLEMNSSITPKEDLAKKRTNFPLTITSTRFPNWFSTLDFRVCEDIIAKSNDAKFKLQLHLNFDLILKSKMKFSFVGFFYGMKVLGILGNRGNQV
jgi:hypothetical protein